MISFFSLIFVVVVCGVRAESEPRPRITKLVPYYTVDEIRAQPSKCEAGLMMRDSATNCLYHVCVKIGSSFRTVPFACPAGTIVAENFMTGKMTPCRVHSKSDGSLMRCGPRVLPITVPPQTCNTAKLLKCTAENCHANDKCVDFQDVPSCIDDCYAEFCPGSQNRLIYKECEGSEMNTLLYTACGAGCFKFPTVANSEFDFKTDYHVVKDCLDTCFNLICKPERYGCETKYREE